MSYPSKVREAAKSLRQKGKSINEISSELSIAKSTTSLWIRDVELPKRIRREMEKNEVAGRSRGLSAIAARRALARKDDVLEAEDVWSRLALEQNADFWKVCAALLFWCEGAKRLSNLVFANSDPAMMKIFLTALRNGFNLDEKKFHVQLHLHEYHDAVKQIQFWSEITGIPTEQFFRPYVKPHTGKRKRDNYPGCASLRYGEARLARKLSAIYHTFVKMT